MNARTVSFYTIALLVLAVGSEQAFAQVGEESLDHTYSDYWTGAHVGFGLFGGPGFLANERFTESTGMAVGVKLTSALALQIFHVQLSYLHSQFAANLEGQPLSLKSHAVGASLGLHPMFLANFYGRGGGYFGASIYFQAGISAEFTDIEWYAESLHESWVWSTHIGAGFDFPIDEVDDGGAFWGGFQWRFNRLPSDFSALEIDETIGQHLFLIRLAYRINGLPF